MDAKVKDHENLVRLGSSGAIVNTDEEELLKYRKRKMEAIRERDREREFQTLKNEVRDLKDILMQIYEKVITST